MRKTKLLPMAAVVTGAMLVIGSVSTIYAQSGSPSAASTTVAQTPVATAAARPSSIRSTVRSTATPKPSPTTVAAPVMVTVAELNERMAQLPQLAGAKDGDQVIITDDGSVTGARFQGTYIYHPAGSQVPLGPMYARWKDGLVAIHMSIDPANASNPFRANAMFPFATFLQQNFGTGTDYLGNGVRVAISQQQVTKPIVSEPTNGGILRIPDGAWLFRDAGNGQFAALTDVFVFQSGDAPQIKRFSTATGTNDWVADGTQQPVGVMFQS